MSTHGMTFERLHGHVPAAARAVGDDWRRLAAGLDTPEVIDGPAADRCDVQRCDVQRCDVERRDVVERFDPDAVRQQPEVVRRWLGRALAPGATLGGAVQLQMHGHIRIGGAWRPFEADQVLAPRGYIWAATAHLGALSVKGFDRYTGGTAEMRWKLLGLVPIVRASGRDSAMSAAGRLASEIVLAPTGFAGADWEETPDPNVARGTFSFPHGLERIDVRVAADGQVQSASMLRWGNPDAGAFARHPFGAYLSDSETFAGGLTIPTSVRAGWGWGTDAWESGEFFRARITGASLLEVVLT